MGKIIAICNQKGGTGKTTTAINLSCFLALSGKKVLMVDLDPQGNATSGAGIDKSKITKSTYHSLLQEVAINDIVLETEIKNMFVAPANIDLTGAEVELVAELSREFRLEKALSQVVNYYDVIIIDCPPSLGLLTINALSAATSVLIPVQCEYYALEGLTQLLNTVNLVKRKLNSKLEIEGVVLTMADFRTNLTKEVIEEAREFFKDKVYKTIIPRNIKLSESPSFGKPIFLYDKTSIGSQKYYDLCCEVLKIDSFEIPQEESKKDEIILSNHLNSNELEHKNNVREGV